MKISGFAIAVRTDGDEKGKLHVQPLYDEDEEKMGRGKIFRVDENDPDTEHRTIHIVRLFDPLYQLFERCGLDHQTYTYDTVVPGLESLIRAVVNRHVFS